MSLRFPSSRPAWSARLRPILALGLGLGLTLLAPRLFAAPATWEAPLRADLAAMADELTATLVPWTVPDRVFLPETYGAVPNSPAVQTAAVQAAIDACSTAGGGVVRLASGDYVTGTLRLKSGVMLEIAAGSRLLGSTAIADYPEIIEQLAPNVMRDNHLFRTSLIYAERVSRVGIRGGGIIDFRGTRANFSSPQTVGPIKDRPFGIRMIECDQVVIQDITLKDAAAWMQNYLACTNLIFERMTVENQANYNNDGLDLDGCRRVIVRDCFINSEDDAMCLKGASMLPTEDVLIEDSTFVTTCNALKIGTDTQGDFRRILARRLTLGGIPPPHRTWNGNREASTGITLATVDGATVEDILIHDVVINTSRCPIYLRIGDRARVPPGTPRPPVGSLHRVIIEDVTGADNRRQGNFISGLGSPRTYIEDVAIRRVNLAMSGGGTTAMITAPVNDSAGSYPDAHQFSPSGLPAFGFYVRSARRITLEDITITPTAPDARPFLFTETADVTLDDPRGHDLHARDTAATITVEAVAPVLAGDLAGAGTFRQTGPSSLTFAEPVSFTGSLQVLAGTLEFAAGQRPGASTPAVPAPTLRHRWTFNHTLADSVGSSPATVIDVGPNNHTLSATALTLAGGPSTQSDYVLLGSNLLGGTHAPRTIELWATQLSLKNWARIFDFGSGGASGDYLLMSWNRGTLATDGVRWRDAGTDALAVNESNQPYTLGTRFHLVMTLAPADAGSTLVTWYRAPATDASLGPRRGQSTVGKTLAQLNDSQDTLGRSLNGSATDEVAHAAYDEVRIWEGTLTPEHLALTHTAGPDSVPSLTGTPGTAEPTPVLASLSTAPGATFALPAGFLQVQTVTNQGRLRLTGDADLRVPGSFSNAGVLDVIRWNRPVPASWTGPGSILDASSVQVKSLNVTDAQALLVIDGLAGHTYQLQQARDGALSGPWDNVLPPVPGADAALTFSVPRPPTPRAFYRVVLGP